MTPTDEFRQKWEQFLAAGFAVINVWQSPDHGIDPSGEPIISNDRYATLFRMSFDEWLHELAAMIDHEPIEEAK